MTKLYLRILFLYTRNAVKSKWFLLPTCLQKQSGMSLNTVLSVITLLCSLYLIGYKKRSMVFAFFCNRLMEYRNITKRFLLNHTHKWCPALTSQETKQLLAFQTNEITEHHIYHQLSLLQKNENNRRILTELAAEESRTLPAPENIYPKGSRA